MFTNIATTNQGSAICCKQILPLTVSFCIFQSCNTTSDGTIYMKTGVLRGSSFIENNANRKSTVAAEFPILATLCSSYKPKQAYYVYYASGELTNSNFTKAICTNFGNILTAYEPTDTKYNNHYHDQPITFSAAIETFSKVSMSYTNVINASMQTSGGFFTIGRKTKVIVENSFFEIHNLTTIVDFFYPTPEDLITIISSVFICPINISHSNISLIDVTTQSDIGEFTYVNVAVYNETKFDSYIKTCNIHVAYFKYITYLYVFIFM